MSNLSKNDPQNIEQNFDELELVAEKAGELNDRVGKIESELGAQTKTLESAALVLDAAIKGLGALKSSVLENDIGALQLALNDKTAHLAREIGRFESAVAEIDRRAESGDDEIKAALLATAQSLRAQFDAKSLEIGEWSARVEKEIAAHSVALAAIPPIIKGADAVGFNPVGEWETGKAFARMDVVSYAGSSYISNVDGNTEKPSKSKNYTVLSKRAGSIGSGGVGGFAELTGTILPAQVVPGSATYAVGDVLYAGTTGALSKLGAGSSGQLLSTQGAGAAPIWVTATGGAGDMNGPASATDNAIVRFDGTGGKTVQNSAVTIADTTGAIAGASSLTAPASTDLTLTGGSTGASLVLGATSTGQGVLTTSGSAVGSLNFQLQVRESGGTAKGLVIAHDSTSQTGVLYPSTTGAAANLAVWNWNGSSLAETARFTANRNLLVGTTSESGLVGAGAIKVGSATASTSTTSGALIVAGGVGVSGAGYFGGELSTAGANGLNITKGTATVRSIVAGGSNELYQVFPNTGTTTSMSWGMGSNSAAAPYINTTASLTSIYGAGGTLGLTVGASGAVTIAGTVIHTLSATPASASATGTVGTMSWDASYIYICTATNTWKRVAIATW